MKAANSVDAWCNSTFHITSLYYYSNALLSLIEYKIAIITSLTNTQIFTYTWARTIVSGDTSLQLPTPPLTADPYIITSQLINSIVSCARKASSLEGLLLPRWYVHWWRPYHPSHHSLRQPYLVYLCSGWKHVRCWDLMSVHSRSKASDTSHWRSLHTR